jgi:hypothetical protein
MDQNPGRDPYDSFCRFQSRLIRQFNKLARAHGFKTIDARGTVEKIQLKLRREVARFLGIELTAEDRVVGGPASG